MMAHGDAREGKWRGNWRMEWVASTLHTASEHGVSSITTADAHTSVASSRLNWRPRRFKWTSLFCRKTKSGFCACAITFQLASNSVGVVTLYGLDATGIESRWGGGARVFRTRPDPRWGPPRLLLKGYRVIPEGKAAGTWCCPRTRI